jgi:putative restriction endonuclease
VRIRHVVWAPAEDARLRREAIAWLTVRSNDGADALSTDEILDFTFDGEPFRLMDAQRGIRKPAVLPHALSIRTVHTPEGGRRPYDDAIGADGLVRYKWRGDDGGHAENRAIRDAMHARVPLIWFFGVATARYLPIFPVHVVGEEPHLQQFSLQVADLPVSLAHPEPDSPVEAFTRRYVTAQTRRRLHQPVFRARVIQAYTTRCAVCALAHAPLLDAAHIAPDADPDGIAAVRNGLALCKIHHAAYDADILGISPDLVVDIRADVLAEIDGPMLRHGLQELHGSRLRIVPRSAGDRPDRDLLDSRWRRYRAS